MSSQLFLPLGQLLKNVLGQTKVSSGLFGLYRWWKKAG